MNVFVAFNGLLMNFKQGNNVLCITAELTTVLAVISEELHSTDSAVTLVI